MIRSTRLSRSWVASVQRYSIVVMLLVVIIVFAAVSKPFFTVTNLSNILLQASATAIAAIGMTFVLVIAEIDISIGSLMSLAMTVAWMLAVAPGSEAGQQAGVNGWVYPVGLLMGLALGIFNGLLINGLRINSFIATLATMFAFRGVAWKMVGSSDKAFADSAVLFLGRTEFLGVGLPVYLMIALAVIAFVVLNRTPLGRYLFAMGGSLRSAVETGLPLNRLRIVAYSVSGLCTATAGLITIGRVGTLQAGLGSGFEFTVIAAVVLGGTSLLGGRGSITGSILGAILLVVIDNGLNLINASIYIYDVVKGLILITAVVIDVALLRRLDG
jgi:ribose/xylose/arabinose/galactoside ABC-type transport system permease subunit